VDRTNKNDKAWKKIFEKYPIEEATKDGGFYEIKASEIKEFREPRLMTKFDTSDSVAYPLKKRGLNILPTSRSSYVIGHFNLYEEFPSLEGEKPTSITLPDFESLRVENITSESNAIRALSLTHTLENFLDIPDETLYETIQGKAGTKTFAFDIDIANAGKLSHLTVEQQTVDVNGAQLEIDGGFESDSLICIMEAKNIRHQDFNVRQLYFPYRLYKNNPNIRKPIRLVFSQYTNLTYYLYEYVFDNPNSFSSIRLVNKHIYTFEDCQITMRDLIDVWENTVPRFDDNQDHTDIPFIQADRFDRVISLVEHLMSADNNTLTTQEVIDFMGLVIRQAYYYPTAGQYLGLIDRVKSEEKRVEICLTPEAKKILGMGYRDRQLAFVKLMFRHKIFHDAFKFVIDTGTIPEKKDIEELMEKYNVCNKTETLRRRATTVRTWLNWILELNDEDEDL